jgi:ABC-type branched-subunit amino acid transport system permease subunit
VTATRGAAGLDSPRARAVVAILAPAAVITAVQLVLFPMPLGVWVQGLTVGLLGALIALGMALIYRANRILNFAQGDLGVVPVTLSVILIQSFAWNYFLALTLGLVVALALGALVELAIIRRFFTAPRLILTVATIGLSQLLAVIALMSPNWIAWLTGRENNEVLATANRISFPADLKFTLDPLIFNTDYVVAWIVVPVMLIGLALWLRFSNVGMAIRASAERSDRASLLGIPVKRLNTYVWMIAALLSFTGLFLRAGITGLPFGSVLSFNVLLMALAALMLGRLTNLPTVATSAIALGLLEQGVSWNDEINFRLFHLNSESAVLITPILGLVIVVALFVQKTGQTRAEQEAGSSWQAAEDVRPLPRELRSLREVQAVRYAVGALVVLAMIGLPHVLDASQSLKASAVLIYAIITLSIVVLTGWAGQVSLGQMGFVAVGGAVGAVATSQWHLDLSLALLVAGIAGALVAIVVGLPALRLRGLYLGVVTLAFGLAVTAYFLNSQFFTWVPTGRIERPPLFGQWSLDSPTRIYYLCLAGLALMLFFVRGIRHSRTGRVLIALRENERGTQAFGVSATRAKLTAFALSGFIAAFAGGLLVHHQQSFSLNLVAADQNLVVFTAAVVGGLGSMLGALLGALYLQGGKWFLTGDLQPFQLLTTSVGVLIVLLVLPGGLGGLVYRARDFWLRSVATRRGIVVPSLLADTRELEQEVEAAFEQKAEQVETTDAKAGAAAEQGVEPVPDASPESQLSDDATPASGGTPDPEAEPAATGSTDA